MNEFKNYVNGQSIKPITDTTVNVHRDVVYLLDMYEEIGSIIEFKMLKEQTDPCLLEWKEYKTLEEQGLLLRLPKSMHDIDKNIIEYALVMATNLSRYGVDIGDKVESATELSYYLNQAYMRGRQDEIDRMNRTKEEAEKGLAEMKGE